MMSVLHESVVFKLLLIYHQVVENERLLRDCLLRDGLKPKPGYTLARYAASL
jgi:hypothetical protein